MNRKSRCSFLGRKSITLWLTPHTLPQVDDVWYMNHHRTVAFFGPLTTRHLWFTVHIFHLPPFSCLFFYVWLWSSWCMQGGSIHWRTKEDKMYVYGLWIWPHDLRIHFFFYHVTLEDNLKDFATVFHMRVQHFPSVHAQKQNPVISGCTQNENEHRWDWLEEMWLSLANERVMTLTQAATCVTGLFPLSHLHSREPWI